MAAEMRASPILLDCFGAAGDVEQVERTSKKYRHRRVGKGSDTREIGYFDPALFLVVE